MSNRKNHHFVPQFFFRRFSANGKSVCAITKATGQIIAQAPIKSKASKNNFYGTVEVENVLGEIEGECSNSLRVLDAIEDPAMLGEDDISRVLMYIALQRSRTMSARMNAQSFQDRMAQLHLEVELNNSTEILQQDQERLVGESRAHSCRPRACSAASHGYCS